MFSYRIQVYCDSIVYSDKSATYDNFKVLIHMLEANLSLSLRGPSGSIFVQNLGCNSFQHFRIL